MGHTSHPWPPYIHRLTGEHMGHVAMARPPCQPTDTFIGDVEPMNVIPHIHQCHVIDECILYSSVPTTDEYMTLRLLAIYLSV
jgi:hypothetical protein